MEDNMESTTNDGHLVSLGRNYNNHNSARLRQPISRRADTATASPFESFYIDSTDKALDVSCLYRRGPSANGVEFMHQHLRTRVSDVHGDERNERQRYVRTIGANESDWLVVGSLSEIQQCEAAAQLLKSVTDAALGFDLSQIRSMRAAEGSEALVVLEEDRKRMVELGVPESLFKSHGDDFELVYDGKINHLSIFMALGVACTLKREYEGVMCMMGVISDIAFVVYAPSICVLASHFLSGNIAPSAFIALAERYVIMDPAVGRAYATYKHWGRVGLPLHMYAGSSIKGRGIFIYDLIAHYITLHMETTATSVGRLAAFFKPLDKSGAVTARFLVDIGTDQIRSDSFGVNTTSMTNKNNKHKAVGEIVKRSDRPVWEARSEVDVDVTTSISTARKLQTWVMEHDPDIVRLQRAVIFERSLPPAVISRMVAFRASMRQGTAYSPFVKTNAFPFDGSALSFVGLECTNAHATLGEQLLEAMRAIDVKFIKPLDRPSPTYRAKNGATRTMKMQHLEMRCEVTLEVFDFVWFTIEDNLEMQRIVKSPVFEDSVAGGIVQARLHTTESGNRCADLFKISKEVVGLVSLRLHKDVIDAVFTSDERKRITQAYWSCYSEMVYRAGVLAHPLFNELAALSLPVECYSLSMLLACTRWHDIAAKLRLIGFTRDGDVLKPVAEFGKTRRFFDHIGNAHSFLYAYRLLAPDSDPTRTEQSAPFTRYQANASIAYADALMAAERTSLVLYSCHAMGQEHVRLGNAELHMSAISPADNHSFSLVGVSVPMFQAADSRTLKHMRKSGLISEGRTLTRMDLKNIESLWSNHSRRLNLFTRGPDYHRPARLLHESLGLAFDNGEFESQVAIYAKVFPSFCNKAIGHALDKFRGEFSIIPLIMELNVVNGKVREKQFNHIRLPVAFVFRKFRIRMDDYSSGAILPNFLKKALN